MFELLYILYEIRSRNMVLYASNLDLSEYNANQFGFGISNTNIFTKAQIGKFGLKSIDIKYYKYDRNSTFNSSIITAVVKFVMD